MFYRHELGPWLQQRGYNTGAEIGVWRGDFSCALLSEWPSGTLYMVDAWEHLSDYQDMCNLSNEEHEKCFEQAQAVAAFFAPRAFITRGKSPAIANDFPAESLDMVYLDANHSYEAVLADLAAWLPKIKPGGVFAGHDYLDGVLREGVFGVKRAVHEFFQRAPDIVMDRDHWPSWLYFV